MSTIKIKRSGTSGQTPTSLDTGELAINYHKDDALLYWKDSDGNVKTTYLKNAPLDSPALTGTPTAPTATSGTNTTQIATTAFVADAVSGISGGTTDAYKTITDGTTNAVASGADTFKIRAGTGVTAVVTSNDGTHGDNVLISLDSELQALAGVTSAADKVPYFTGSGSASVTDLTSTARSLLDDTSFSAMRTTLGLGTMSVETATDYLKTTDAATTYQPLDATLTSLASLGTTGNKIAYTTATDTWAETGITSFGRTFINSADAAAGRTNLSLGTIATEAQSSYYTKTAADAAFQPLDSTLTSLAAFNSNGLLVQTGADTFVARSLSAGTGISITNADGGSGSPTISNTGVASYPSSGIPNSTGSAWGTSYSTSGSGTTVALTTSPSFTTPVLGTPTSGNLSNCTQDGTNSVGFLVIPQNSKSAAYTTVLADAGKHIYYNSSSAYTVTIDSNANVAYAVGTALTFINMGSGNVTIAITSDTLTMAGTGSTGSRTLAQYGMATAIKLTSTTWIISGTNLT